MAGSKMGKELVHKLLTEGPVNFASASGRRVRATFGGHWIVDTTDAVHVWEHKFYPQLYIPWSALKEGSNVSVAKVEAIEEKGVKVASILEIKAGQKSTKEAIYFEEIKETGKLSGLVKIDFAAIDQWYEEEQPIYVHPKDPTKRIDILHSTRPIEVQVDGHVLAKTDTALHLIEPMLPVRYYLPPTSVDPSILRTSETRTKCPYKGEAEYYDVVIGGKTYKDLIWWYRNPTTESVVIQGAFCFYNEKVDVVLDGKKLERPKTHFA
ncbi:DUF427-domain-containing protein [Rhizodiscina lignyota]|uniref:DUF427-domain-containing protein n=1 Tax=Rhizodiscina lignyota TaxID=1504668 RepID=A0A9P4IEV2_9PEZI|nr:DUF427-domain-containing protein [Rhizodiscina lignyota]